MATRLYDIRHVNGDTYEIEADYFQREGGDWVFYVAQDEVYRVAFLDVLGVSKTPAWVHEQPSVHSARALLRCGSSCGSPATEAWLHGMTPAPLTARAKGRAVAQAEGVSGSRRMPGRDL